MSIGNVKMGRVCELNNVVIKRGEGVLELNFKTHPRVNKEVKENGKN